MQAVDGIEEELDRVAAERGAERGKTRGGGWVGSVALITPLCGTRGQVVSHPKTLTSKIDTKRGTRFIFSPAVPRGCTKI